MKRVIAAISSLALLAGCSQSDAPSDQLAAEAEDLVGSVMETPSVAPELGKYAPRDDCGDLQGAKAFKQMLDAAVAMRDTDVLVALSASDVKLGFGGVDGVANLRKALDAEGSTLWDEIDTLTDMGCAVNSQGGITMPWYFAQDIGGDVFDTMIAIGSDVPVHAEPRADGARIATLNWDAVGIVREGGSLVVVSPAADGDAGSWTHVRLRGIEDAEAEDGYVRADRLRSVIDYRLTATSRNGRWRITSLLAGD